jgi:hypothetical protein
MSRRAFRHEPREGEISRAEANEIGLDDSHIPGGIPHVQLQPAAPHRPLDIGPHADYYAGEMAGGVPYPVHPHGGHQKPDHWDRSAREATLAAPPPGRHRAGADPIPVYVVEQAGGGKPLASLAGYQVLVPAAGSPAVRLATRDLTRRYIRITAEGELAAGNVIEEKPANPAASDPLLYTMPFAAQLLAATWTYTASATAGNRYPTIGVLDPSGATVLLMSAGGPVVASTALEPFMSSTSPYMNETAEYASYGPIWSQVIPQGWQIELTAAGGMTAGDQISGVIFLFSNTMAAGIRIATAQGSAPTGYLIDAGDDRRIEAQDEIWAVSNTDAPVYASVLCEYDIRNGA